MSKSQQEQNHKWLKPLRLLIGRSREGESIDQTKILFTKGVIKSITIAPNQ